MPTFPQALPVGTELGNFELRAVLGQGGGGFAYLCYDTLLEREVVLKEHFPQGLCRRMPDGEVVAAEQEEERFEQSLNLFLQEARTLAGLRHAGIVRILEVMPTHGTAVAVMEPVQGETLDTYLARRHDDATVLRLLRQLLEIVGFLHTHHVIHRDIKPANIVVQQDGSPVLLDFGAALRGEPGGLRTIIGTPAFAAPEQFDPSGAIGPWSDIYALGMTFHHELGAERVSELPRRLRRSLYRATRKDPARRFPNAAAWLQALRRPWHAAALLGAALMIAGFLAALPFMLPKPEATPTWDEKELRTIAEALRQSQSDAEQNKRPLNSLASAANALPDVEIPPTLAGQRLSFNPAQELVALTETEHTDWEKMTEEERSKHLQTAFAEPHYRAVSLSFEPSYMDFPDADSWKVCDQSGKASYKPLSDRHHALLTITSQNGEPRFYLLRFINDYSGTLAVAISNDKKVFTQIPFTLLPTAELESSDTPAPEAQTH